MAASTLAFLDVFVLFALVASLLSCTRIVMMSPTARARLSANIDRELSSFHSDWAVEFSGRIVNTTRVVTLQNDDNGLFILNLSGKFPFCFWIANPHRLTR